MGDSIYSQQPHGSSFSPITAQTPDHRFSSSPMNLPQYARQPSQSHLTSSMDSMEASVVTSVARKVYAKARQSIPTIPACENLSHLLSALVNNLQLYSDYGLLADNDNAQHLMHELSEQLEMAMRGIERVSLLPEVYRAINALRITTEFRNFCHSLGLTLEGLHSLLSECTQPGAEKLFEEMKRLEWAFRTAQFPLEERDLKLYKEMRRICSCSYTGRLSSDSGVEQARDALERAFGPECLEENWKLVSKQLYQDLDAARVRRDVVEQHTTRLILGALSHAQQAPPEYFCPLTMELMEEPVVLLETGVTVERRNLDMWLYGDGSRICPVSGKPLTDTRIIENKAIRSLIDDWRVTNPSLAEQRARPRNSARATGSPSKVHVHNQADGRENRGSRESIPYSNQSDQQAQEWGHEEDWNASLSSADNTDAAYAGGSDAVLRNLERFKDIGLTDPQGHIDDGRTNKEVGHNLVVTSSVEQHNPDDKSSIAETMMVAAYAASDLRKMAQKKRISYWGVQGDLFCACEDGDLPAVKAMVEDGAEVHSFDDGGWTCMHWAALKGRTDVLVYLIELNREGIDAQAEVDHTTPLYVAASEGQSKAVNMLLQKGASIQKGNKKGWTALHVAADQGHSEACVSILKHAKRQKIDAADAKTEAGWTPLHHACRIGHEDTIKALTKHMTDVNQRCREGWTALHVAVDNCHLKAVELLLKKTNANPNVQSRPNGDLSVRSGGLVRVLRCSIDYTSAFLITGLGNADGGWTPLHAAQDKNQVDIGKLLLKYGADPDVQGDDGATALHRACFMGNMEFAMLLVNEGKANLAKKMHKSGRKAVQIASDNNHTELYNFLYWQGLQRMLKTKLSTFRII